VTARRSPIVGARREWAARTLALNGPGVIGKTPVLKPGEEFEFVRHVACFGMSSRNRMRGAFQAAYFCVPINDGRRTP
jgi:uncharacterized protein affecting Mg2+/Co2+ transport